MKKELKAHLLKIKKDQTQAALLTKLLYQLGKTGWPTLNKSAAELLKLKGLSKIFAAHPQLFQVMSDLSTLEPKMSSYQSPHNRPQGEIERLIDQLRALLTDLELHLTLQAKDELTTLSDTLWLGATQWLFERAHEVRDHALVEQLADLSSALGERLLLDPEGFFAEATKMISARLTACGINKVDFNPMVSCPAGEFWMGSEGVGKGNEHPRHRVKISKPFLIGETQVTQALWQVVMGDNPSRFEGLDLPVDGVSWFDMVRFCNRLSELENFRPAYDIGSGDEPNVSLDFSANGYRLPTEAEWEYAAKAGTELVYAGSANVDEVAWYGANSGGKTHKVATKKPNAWGLYDMGGNVYEWCHDQWDNETDKSRPKVSCDPCHDTSEPTRRVLRGGCWLFGADLCRVAYRYGSSANYRWMILGGRLLRSNID